LDGRISSLNLKCLADLLGALRAVGATRLRLPHGKGRWVTGCGGG